MNSGTQTLAASIRANTLRVVSRARTSHVGGGLSMADLLAVLYGEILRVFPGEPLHADRDRLILSKGHACAALYSALAIKGFFPLEELEQFGRDAARLMSHTSHKVPGVEISTGSLGHGLGIGCGKALAAKRQKGRWRVYVILSDGELDEGSNWEAILFAPQHRLDNVVAIVDFNKIQSFGTVSDVLELQPLAEKFRAFRWSVREVDGHDHVALKQALGATPWEPGKPSCLIAHTIKGKGVAFMENQLLWHYRPPDAGQLASALAQLGCEE